MEKLQALRELNQIKMKFHKNEHNVQTISHLITWTRANKYVLEKEQIQKILEISIDILENDVEIKNKAEFKKFGGYFSGNIRLNNDNSLLKFKKIFGEREHTLADIVDFTKLIHKRILIDESIRFELEFLLRNVEVVIRDYVSLYSYSNFKDSGSVYVVYIDDIMKNIVNRKLK